MNAFIIANYSVPSGTFVVFSIIEAHRDKSQWGEDAYEFRPERFEEDNIKDIHPYSYAPFSKGSRICPGHKYAMMTMKAFLSKFLIKYRVATNTKYEELDFILELTLSVKQGFTMKVEKRLIE